MPRRGHPCAEVIIGIRAHFLPTNSSVLVDGEERGRGTAARKHLARDIAANVALAFLREENT
jgi:hypothetical protein